MTELSGFWSYVHKDDDADGARIVQLAHDIVAQYEMRSNDTIQLFLDRDDMAWGNEWQAKIDNSLAAVAFFIPVLTPRYFASAACRGELNTFARRADDRGISQLLLPILYMDFPGINDADPSEDLIGLVKRFQWVDWRDLRFAEPSSREYRVAVSALAERLVEANAAAESTTLSSSAPQQGTSDGYGDPGSVELLAAFELALPKLTLTTVSMGESITELGVVAEEISADTGNAANQSFAARLQLMRRFAARISAPAASISEQGDNFASQLHDVDLGVRVAIEHAREEPDSKNEFCSFFSSIRSMVSSAHLGLGALQGLADSFAPLEKLSRDVRPPLRDIRHGLTLMLEGLDVMRPWLQLMDESGIECEPSEP